MSFRREVVQVQVEMDARGREVIVLRERSREDGAVRNEGGVPVVGARRERSDREERETVAARAL